MFLANLSLIIGQFAQYIIIIGQFVQYKVIIEQFVRYIISSLEKSSDIFSDTLSDEKSFVRERCSRRSIHSGTLLQGDASKNQGGNKIKKFNF